MKEKKEHLVLEWCFDCETQELTCSLADGECVYVAHNGGKEGYTKTYQGNTETISSADWEQHEKYWISDMWGETYGYFQPDPNREAIEPMTGLLEGRMHGIGRHGEYLDHLQRSQRQLDHGDMAVISHDSSLGPLFLTPDCGLTIYKLLLTNDSFYNGNYNKETNEGVWFMVPQPCMMQPNSIGYVLSSHEELELAGLPKEVIDRCKEGLWDKPPFPEISKLFNYPKENKVPLTKENLRKIY